MWQIKAARGTESFLCPNPTSSKVPPPLLSLSLSLGCLSPGLHLTAVDLASFCSLSTLKSVATVDGGIK